MPQVDRLKKAIQIFQKAGGTLRMSEAVRLGVHRRDLYRLRDEGKLEVLSRGLYRLADLPTPSLPDFFTIAKKIPDGVICLISALAFHEMTTQIPHFVYLALPHKSRKPSIKYPPMRFFWYGEKSLKTGVEEHMIDGCPVKIFDREKTLIDVVRYRNKLGMDIVIEALRMYWQSRATDLTKLYNYAVLFRVEQVLRPIMETIISE
ncbi:MAG: hypothetical protein KR126chlam1_01182 [Chlamydiae bacterium]|nr:hypothetical protein [Chlamydiota bacterium]